MIYPPVPGHETHEQTTSAPCDVCSRTYRVEQMDRMITLTLPRERTLYFCSLDCHRRFFGNAILGA